MARHAILAAAFAAPLLTACAGSPPAVDPAQAGSTVAVVTAPAETSVQPGTQLRFSAQVAGATSASVVWSVDEPDGGTIDSSGIYTAPANEGTFHVRAEHDKSTGGSVVAGSALRVAGDASTSLKKGGGSSVVHVSKTAAQTLAVSIAPTASTLDACGGQVFKASVTGVVDTRVTWTVTEAGGGTVQDGAYTAPPAPGTYHVVVASVADPSRVARSTITVGPEKVLSLAVAPGSGGVRPNGTLALSATMTTSCGTFQAQ